MALSYDTPDQLRLFSARHQIQFPLLSDPDSKIIREFGLLNTSYATDSRYYGVPYPGIFLITAEGKIRAKFAEENYRNRPVLTDLKEAALNLLEIE